MSTVACSAAERIVGDFGGVVGFEAGGSEGEGTCSEDVEV